MRFGYWLSLSAAALSILFAGSALAADRNAPLLGAAPVPPVLPRAATDLGVIAPRVVFSNAQFASGGVGLRNHGAGGITISGVTKPVKAAYLYWAVITDGPPPPEVSSVLLVRKAPGGVSAKLEIAGTAIGTTGSCWVLPSFTTTVFRGTVPLSIANGNGLYIVWLKPGAGGSIAGEDPFVGLNLPLWQGASLVLVGTGTGKVAIYDDGLAGNKFLGNPGLEYRLELPVNANSVAEVRWHNIGADGQKIIDPPDEVPFELANEITTINRVRVAGPGSRSHDSLWNGNSALPLPQLWDDAGFDITAAAQQGRGRRLGIKHFVTTGGFSDCLVPVANVVALY